MDNITRLNALALGWAINLIVIFHEYPFPPSKYALASLVLAWLCDMSACLGAPRYVVLLSAASSVVLSAIAVFNVLFL